MRTCGTRRPRRPTAAAADFSLRSIAKKLRLEAQQEQLEEAEDAAFAADAPAEEDEFYTQAKEQSLAKKRACRRERSHPPEARSRPRTPR